MKDFVLSHKSWFVKIWNLIELAISLVSGYVYMFFAAFGHKILVGTMFHELVYQVELGTEVFFALTVLRNFITDFNRDGEKVPVK